MLSIWVVKGMVEVAIFVVLASWAAFGSEVVVKLHMIGFGVMSVVQLWVSVIFFIGVVVNVSVLESFESPPKFGEVEHIFLNNVIVVQHWDAKVVVLNLEALSWLWDDFFIGIWELIICWLNHWGVCDLVVQDCW